MWICLLALASVVAGDTWVTQLSFESVWWIEQSGSGSLGGVYFDTGGNPDVVTNISVCPDGPACAGIPWVVNAAPDPGGDAEGLEYTIEITDASALAGQYLIVEGGLSGFQNSFNFVGANIVVDYVLTCAIEYTDGMGTLLSQPPSTTLYQLGDQWSSTTFLLIPADTVTDGGVIKLAVNVFKTIETEEFKGKDANIIPPTGYLRVHTHHTSIPPLGPIYTSACQYEYSGAIRVFDSRGSIADFRNGGGFSTTCSNPSGSPLTLGIADDENGDTVMTVTAKTDDAAQYVLFESTMFGQQVDTAANNFAHGLQARVLRGGASIPVLVPTIYVSREFYSQRARGVTTTFIVPPEYFEDAGDVVEVKFLAQTLTGRGSVTLSDSRIGKDGTDLPPSGISARATAYSIV